MFINKFNIFIRVNDKMVIAVFKILQNVTTKRHQSAPPLCVVYYIYNYNIFRCQFPFIKISCTLNSAKIFYINYMFAFLYTHLYVFIFLKFIYLSMIIVIRLVTITNIIAVSIFCKISLFYTDLRPTKK